MATSGAYAFNPGLGEIVLNALAKCRVARTSVTAQHLDDARLEANFMMAEWAASGINLWTVDEQTVALVAGTASYSVPATTVFILDAFIRTDASSLDRIILPVGRSTYSSYPNKSQQGTVTTYWFDRIASPTINLYLVPDASSTYTLHYWRARQLQDAELSDGATPEVPWRFLDAFAKGLAARLATIYAPEKTAGFLAMYNEAFANATRSNTENVQIQIIPSMQGYFR